MNTIKLYQINSNDFVLQINSGLQYTIANGAIWKSNVNISELEETTFDIITQSYVDNAISNVNTLVTSVNELNLLQAIIQEKIEDFE